MAALRKLTNAGKSEIVVDGITAQSLNDYYAATSTDSDYVEPKRRRQMGRDDRGAQQVTQYVSEWQVFQLLDKLRPTAAGTDVLPAWYSKLGATVFCGPLQNLFNQSSATSTVPTQCKQAAICPVVKVATPISVKDYCPISVTPILTCMMERTVVRQFLYPAFLTLPPNLTFEDQDPLLPPLSNFCTQ